MIVQSFGVLSLFTLHTQDKPDTSYHYARGTELLSFQCHTLGSIIK